MNAQLNRLLKRFTTKSGLTAAQRDWLVRAAEGSRPMLIPLELAVICIDCRQISNSRSHCCTSCGSQSIRNLQDLFQSVFGSSSRFTGNAPKDLATIRVSA